MNSFYNKLHNLVMLCLMGSATIFSSLTVQGQEYFTGVPSSGGGNTIPFYYTGGGCRGQQLYPAGAFGSVPSGQYISKIYFASTTAGSQLYTNFEVKLKQANISSLSNTYETGMTTVLAETNYTLNRTAYTYYPIELETPFLYNPSLPIIVEINQQSSGGSSHSTVVQSTISGSWRNYAIGYNAAVASGNGAYTLFFGFDLDAEAVPNNAGISAIPSLEDGFCADTIPIDVEITNFGNNILDSVYVDWSVNSTAQTGQWFVINLDTAGSADNDTVVNLGSYVFANGPLYDVKVWTSLPNNQTDTVNNNDTTAMTVGAALAGTYVIGTGGGADYPTFTAAVADLNLRGICESVVFNVQTGTYTEQIQINQFVGASEDATVTFKSLTGNPADVNLTFAGTTTTNMHVVKWNGCDWVTFKDMTITNTGTTYSVGFEVASGSNYNTVDGCSVLVANIASTYSNTVRMYPSITTGNTFKNGVFSGGYYNMYCYSGSSTSFGYDLTIENNLISTGYYYSIYNYSYRNSKIRGNTITANVGSPYMYGIYMLYSDMSEITGNYIYSTQGSGAIYAVYISQTYGSFNQPLNVSNNCIISGYQGATSTTSYYGLYIASSGLMNVYNNTITKYSGLTTYPLLYITSGTLVNVMNNNLTSYIGSQAMYVSNTIGLGMSDHNNFYTSAGSLVYYAGATFNDLASYQTATGYDANSVSEDPDFQVAYECITCNEELDNAGTVTGITEDIVGNVRSTVTPDIGAVEYVVGSSFTLGPDTTYCGSRHVLEAGPAQSIAWNVNSQVSSADTVLLSTSGSTPMNFNVQVAVVTQYCGSGADVAVIRLIPNTHLDSTDHLCAGTTTSLNAGGGSQATYMWSTGETTSTITVGDAGNYSVTKNEEGCESSASIAITKSTAVNIDDVEGCEADGEITIDATIPDGLNYAWSGGSSINTAINSFGETGTYTITATDSYGCSSNDVFNVSFIDVPVPSITETHLGSVFFFSSATSLFAGNGATYFWDFGDGTTSTDANPAHAYIWSGAAETFNVTLTITNSCGQDVTNTSVTYDVLSVVEVQENAMLVYPIPASNQVTIEFGEVINSLEWQVLDLAGRVVMSGAANSTASTVINLNTLASGSYFIKANGEEYTQVSSLIVE